MFEAREKRKNSLDEEHRHVVQISSYTGVAPNSANGKGAVVMLPAEVTVSCVSLHVHHVSNPCLAVSSFYTVTDIIEKPRISIEKVTADATDYNEEEESWGPP